MYVNPFIAGIICTVLAEAVIIVVAACISVCKDKNK